MARKPRWEFRLQVRGTPVLGFLAKEVGGGGIIAKPSAPGVAVPHLHAYPRDGKLYRHVTHEQYSDGRRHTQKRSISMEEMVRLFLSALAPDDDPPPRLTSFSNQVEMDRLAVWFGRILLNLFRLAEDKPVRVLTGPLGDLMEKAMSGTAITSWELDLTSYFVHEMEGRADEELFETYRETDLMGLGRGVAFSDDLSKMIVVLPQGFVMELSFEALQRASDMLGEMLGFEGYFRSLKRRGYPNRVVADALSPSE